MNKMPLHIFTRTDNANFSAFQCRLHAPNTWSSSWSWVQLTSIFSLPCVRGNSELDPAVASPVLRNGEGSQSSYRWWDPVHNSTQKKLLTFLAAKAHCWLFHQDCKAASQPVSPQPALVHVVIPPQVQDLVFPFLECSETITVCPFL